METPVMRGKSRTYEVRVGQNVSMDCEVERLGHFPLLWARLNAQTPNQPAVFGVGTFPIGMCGCTLMNKTTADGTTNIVTTLTNVNEEQAGQYQCSVNYGDDLKLVHTLVVLSKSARRPGARL